ncbi:MAG: tetratricopeptide repeat protein [Acidobacteria bacterium]|nr:tetratricopeptide repeat protein [Acidobacteriota bacterium]
MLSGRTIRFVTAGICALAFAADPLAEARRHIDAGRLGDARALLDHLRKSRPGDPEVLLTALVVDYRLGSFAAVVSCVDRSTALGANLEARILRAAALDALGRDEEADAELERLLKTPGAAARPALHLGRGQLLLQRGLNQQALAEFEEARRLAPQWAEAMMWQGVALMKLGRTNSAVDAAEAAERAAPEMASVHSLLLKLYRLTGQEESAARQAAWLRRNAGAGQ